MPPTTAVISKTLLTGTILLIAFFLINQSLEVSFFRNLICILGKCTFAFIITIGCIVYLNYYHDRKTKNAKIDSTGKAVLVTGCDSGFGFETALRLYCSGFHVYAGCLQAGVNGALTLAKVDGSRKLVPFPLDVTNQTQVDSAYEFIDHELKTKQLQLWAVINNAGITSFAELEFCATETYQRILDINTLGIIRITKKFLPLLKISQGRLVMISSLAGLLSYPGLTAYCMSKHAVSALATVLQKEFKKWNISVTTVEATGYRTQMIEPTRLVRDMEYNWNSTPEEIRATYGEDYFINFRDRCLKKLMSVNGHIGEAVDTIVNTVESRYVRERYFTSIRAEMRAMGRWLSPLWQDVYMTAFESFEPVCDFFCRKSHLTCPKLDGLLKDDFIDAHNPDIRQSNNCEQDAGRKD